MRPRPVLLGLLAWLLWATCAQAAVALDANATADATNNGVTTIDLTTLTVGSGSNRALVVQLNFSLKTISSLTVTWDNGGTNQACAVIVAQNTTGTDGRAELWGLVAPTSGNKTLRVSWTGSSDVVVNAVAWTGVNQTGGTTSFPHSTNATGTSSAPSVAITSASGNATMDAVTIANGFGTLGSPTQTQTYLDNNPANISTGGSRAAGAASVTHAWTISGASETWVSVGTDIAAASGGCTLSPTQTLLGVGNCKGDDD